MEQRTTRSKFIFMVVVLVCGALLWAFWPRPVLVDIGEIKYGPMVLTINEEGKTRVRETYVISTPVAGKLLRVEVEPGDPVIAGKTIVARMLPSNPVVLDARTREQAQASLDAAIAAVKAAQASLNKALASKDLAESDLQRKKLLWESQTISKATLDKAEQVWQAAKAEFDEANALVALRKADLAKAEAQLDNFNYAPKPMDEGTLLKESIPIYSPTSGRILRLLEESETTLPAGKPIIEIGDISNGLEIITELLSTDAVQIKPGQSVNIVNWGSPEILKGVVDRVDPWGFTKFSALGVEEQRVNCIIKFTSPLEQRKGLGDRYRVEVQVIIWQDDNALLAPSSALFRQGKDWAVFVIANNKAVLKKVTVGHNNGIQAEIKEGLTSGNKVILYPSSGITNGTKVKSRETETS